MYVFCPIPARYLTQCFPYGGFSFENGEACVLFIFGLHFLRWLKAAAVMVATA